MSKHVNVPHVNKTVTNFGFWGIYTDIPPPRRYAPDLGRFINLPRGPLCQFAAVLACSLSNCSCWQVGITDKRTDRSRTCIARPQTCQYKLQRRHRPTHVQGGKIEVLLSHFSRETNYRTPSVQHVPARLLLSISRVSIHWRSIKARVPGGENRVIQFVFTWYILACDRQTDRQTDGRTDGRTNGAACS